MQNCSFGIKKLARIRPQSDEHFDIVSLRCCDARSMKRPPKKQRATRKHGADESAELFRAATKAGGESEPKVDKKVKKLAKAFREDDPTQDDHSKFKKIPRSLA